MNILQRLIQPPRADVVSCLAETKTVSEAVKTLITRLEGLERRLNAIQMDRAAESAELLAVAHRLDHAHKSILGRITRAAQLADGEQQSPRKRLWGG